MLYFLFKRITLLIPTFIGITIVAFSFVRILPGDPVLLMAGERGISDERYARLLADRYDARAVAIDAGRYWN